jgi:hypothetical protein
MSALRVLVIRNRILPGSLRRVQGSAKNAGNYSALNAMNLQTIFALNVMKKRIQVLYRFRRKNVSNLIFDFVQKRFETARKKWAEFGGERNHFRLAFWSWLYSSMNVPEAEK